MKRQRITHRETTYVIIKDYEKNIYEHSKANSNQTLFTKEDTHNKYTHRKPFSITHWSLEKYKVVII